ncbi:MAG: aminotransferase class I/II-fold pyridoxal phosphate-dependent enzyme, partial [Pseudomonadota bacterium]
MHPSTRIQSIVDGADDGWGVFYRAREMKAAGQPVIMLSIGDHDIKTDVVILDAMKAAMDAGNLGYAAVEGSAGLREAIAQRITATRARGATADQIAVTPGGQSALYSAMVACLDPGESCVVLDPFYATYSQTVRAASARAIHVPCRAEDGFQPDPAAIEAALAPDTKAILINTPNNPSGAVYTRARMEGLADLCLRCGLWLISDEVYDTQVWDGPFISAWDLQEIAEQCLLVGSMSKSHG